MLCNQKKSRFNLHIKRILKDFTNKQNKKLRKPNNMHKKWLKNKKKRISKGSKIKKKIKNKSSKEKDSRHKNK